MAAKGLRKEEALVETPYSILDNTKRLRRDLSFDLANDLSRSSSTQVFRRNAQIAVIHRRLLEPANRPGADVPRFWCRPSASAAKRGNLSRYSPAGFFDGAGEDAIVSHVFHPSGRFCAANSQ
jgi:hypothetical protein